MLTIVSDVIEFGRRQEMCAVLAILGCKKHLGSIFRGYGSIVRYYKCDVELLLMKWHQFGDIVRNAVLRGWKRSEYDQLGLPVVCSSRVCVVVHRAVSGWLIDARFRLLPTLSPTNIQNWENACSCSWR